MLAAERARIFGATWQPVGRLEDVPRGGSFFTAEIDERPIVVTRDAHDEVRAFYNVCRHRAGPVATGRGERRSLTCRYHGWTYALDGTLRSTPELGAAQGFDRACHGLVPVRVDTFGPFVFACLDPDVAPLASVLGDIPRETATLRLEAMRFAARRDYEVACNWKAYVDNFLEGYHIPTVHPSLHDVLDYRAYEVRTERMYSRQVTPIKGSTGTADSGDALYYWVFPNWMLSIYPDNMSLNVVLPRGVDRCITVFEWYRPAPIDRGALETTMAFSHAIQEEDIAICEAVQRGLASGAYERGRFSVERENGVHHFQRLVHEHLTAER